MYGKTSLGADQLTSRLSPQRKRALVGAGIAVVLGLGGVGVWAATAPDTYAGSGAGCVNVTVPNSTGGATLHYCGSGARTFCHTEFAASANDPIAVRARPQCRLAGLGR